MLFVFLFVSCCVLVLVLVTFLFLFLFLVFFILCVKNKNCLSSISSKKKVAEILKKKRRKEEKKRGCLIFEHEIEAARGIFWENCGAKICLGILLRILSVLIYSGPQTDKRSKSNEHFKFTGHICYLICYHICYPN